MSMLMHKQAMYCVSKWTTNHLSSIDSKIHHRWFALMVFTLNRPYYLKAKKQGTCLVFLFLAIFQAA